MLFKTDDKARTQHDAVRNNIGWYRWTHDLVEVKGSDAEELLDYLYVNSIAGAPIGRSKYTTMLNEEGKIIDDVIVTHRGENLYWVSTLYAPKLIPWIEKYADGKDVECKNITYDVDMYAIQGPNSPKMMNALLGTPIDDLKRFQMEDNTVDGITVQVHRSGFTGEIGYEIYCDIKDSESVAQAIRKAAKDCDAMEMTILEVYVRSLPMEKGLALRQDMYGLTPYEVGLEWSVNLSKDFVGKEALAQAAEEGPVQKLVGLEFEAESYEDINQSEHIRMQGRNIGLVRAAIYGYTIDKNIGFAVVDARFAEPGTRVEIGTNNSPAIIVEKQWI